MNDLVLKLPKNKLPFIGIEFENESVASRINADLVEHYNHHEFRIVLEFINKYLSLRLICEEALIIRFYNDIRFEPEKLKNWLYIIEKRHLINFGHVYKQTNSHKIVHLLTIRKNFVLKVNKVEFYFNEPNDKPLLNIQSKNGNWDYF